MASIWEEVKGRRIFRAATLYAAISWGVIQIADVLLPVLQFPDWVMSSMVVVAFSGFPIALIIGWLLDIKNEKTLLSQSVTASSSGVKSSFSSRLIELFIISLFAFFAALLYLNNQSNQSNDERSGDTLQLSSVQSLTQNLNNQRTIAVLPFSNFGDSKQDEYFADGLSEELLNVLAKNKMLRVAARTSSFQYKNKNLNIRTIGKELGVQYILEGSVRRSGEQIRVTAQLIDANDDVHIFSSTWDKDLTNIFKVQDEIALSVLETLEIKLLGKTKTNDSIGTKSIAAFAEYSKGVAGIRARSKQGFSDAKNFLNSAINIDPNYAEAYAMLAETYLLEASYDSNIEAGDAQVVANNYLEKALSLNAELAIGHSVKGLLHWQRSNDSNNPKSELQNAKLHLNHAIQLNPSSAEAYMWYGSILINEGKYLDGSKLHKKAYEIDPQAAVVGFNRAEDLIRQGDYDGAMQVFNNIVRNNPDYDNAYTIAGEISLSKGDLFGAYNHFNRAKELGSDEWVWRVKMTKIYLAVGEHSKAQENLDVLALKQGKGGNFNYVENVLQPEMWLASGQVGEIKRWVSSFDKESSFWHERLWRGYVDLSNDNWKNSIKEFEKTKELLKNNKTPFNADIEIRLNILLSKAWKELGDSIRTENYLNLAQEKIDYLINTQNFSPVKFRYHQAAIDNISGNQLKALNTLKQAIKEGFVDVWSIKMDPVFDDVRTDPIYIELISDLERQLEKARKAIFPEEKVVMNS